MNTGIDVAWLAEHERKTCQAVPSKTAALLKGKQLQHSFRKFPGGDLRQLYYSYWEIWQRKVPNNTMST